MIVCLTWEHKLKFDFDDFRLVLLLFPSFTFICNASWLEKGLVFGLIRLRIIFIYLWLLRLLLLLFLVIFFPVQSLLKEDVSLLLLFLLLVFSLGCEVYNLVFIFVLFDRLR